MWASGATIRNTFIHYPTTSEEDEDCAAPRPRGFSWQRARSAPATRRSASAAEPGEEGLVAVAPAAPAASEVPATSLPCGGGAPCEVRRGDQRSHAHEARGAKTGPRRRGAERNGSASGSTASLEEEDHAAWETSTAEGTADSDGPDSEQIRAPDGKEPIASTVSDRLSPDCRATAERIVGLIHEQCGFLLVRGHGVYPENGERMRQRGIAATLRFYVYGLPWAKRAKWLQPLQRSVAAVIQRTEPWVIVRGGVLFAPIDTGASGSPSGESRDQTLAEFFAARPDLPPGDLMLVTEALDMAGLHATSRNECTLEELTTAVGCVGVKTFVASLPTTIGVRHSAALARFLPRLKADVCMRIDFAAARQ